MNVIHWIVGGCFLTDAQAMSFVDAAYTSAESLATALFAQYPVDNVSENILVEIIARKKNLNPLLRHQLNRAY